MRHDGINFLEDGDRIAVSDRATPTDGELHREGALMAANRTPVGRAALEREVARLSQQLGRDVLIATIVDGDPPLLEVFFEGLDSDDLGAIALSIAELIEKQPLAEVAAGDMDAALACDLVRIAAVIDLLSDDDEPVADAVPVVLQ